MTSGIGGFGGSAALYYQMNARMMQDAASVEEGDEEGQIVGEAEQSGEAESAPDAESAEAGDGTEVSQVGGQLDAWG
jgi:hypothetical protein